MVALHVLIFEDIFMTIEIKTTTVIPTATRKGAGRKPKYNFGNLKAGQHIEVETDNVARVRGAVAAFKRHHKDDLVAKKIKLVTRSFVNKENKQVVGVYAQEVEDTQQKVE